MLRVSNLSKGFEGTALFHNLSFDFLPGKITGLLGRNGAGKSTLGKILLGLIEPDEGRVASIDPATEEPDEMDLREQVYYIFQNPDDQIVGTLVRDDVAFGCENRSVPREEIISRVNSALERTGLLDFEKINPVMLSGGQKQRLAIAGALAVEARYLILDEPTAMLDPDGRREVLKLLKELAAEGIGILLITHLPDEVLCCDRLLLLKNKGLEGFDHPTRFFLEGGCEELEMELPDEVLIKRMGLWHLLKS